MSALGWRGLLNLVLETNCPLCQRATAQDFCHDCQRQVQQCQLPAVEQFQAGQPVLFAWGDYGGALKRVIAALKYEKHAHVAQPLAHCLAQAWLSAAPKPGRSLTVVPIPIHPSKRKQRGFNQADLLAEHFCQITRLPLELQGLLRSRATEAQFGLSSSERERNLTDAFSLGPGFLKRPPAGAVLLLDDIYTTGATAKSAAQTLRRHGISVYGMAVIAKTRKL